LQRWTPFILPIVCTGAEAKLSTRSLYLASLNGRRQQSFLKGNRVLGHCSRERRLAYHSA
jgi:hypothetical protein